MSTLYRPDQKNFEGILEHLYLRQKWMYLIFKIITSSLLFQADPNKSKRTEDAIIAWTWKTFVEQKGADPEILLRMPMTKVRHEL